MLKVTYTMLLVLIKGCFYFQVKNINKVCLFVYIPILGHARDFSR